MSDHPWETCCISEITIQKPDTYGVLLVVVRNTCRPIQIWTERPQIQYAVLKLQVVEAVKIQRKTFVKGKKFFENTFSTKIRIYILHCIICTLGTYLKTQDNWYLTITSLIKRRPQFLQLPARYWRTFDKWQDAKIQNCNHDAYFLFLKNELFISNMIFVPNIVCLMSTKS